ncbi:MAG: 7-cyano-7-deazaguanine synthase QueC [Bacteriovoracia bacterium]
MALKKKAIVVHSGGMDSSLCLALAVKEFGASNVLALSFDYHQRHSIELTRAKMIAAHFGVDHAVLSITALHEITENSLTRDVPITHAAGSAPNTLVAGRNGLMARLAGIHAHTLGAKCIYLGVMELEAANSGYRDCSRAYMDLIQEALRMDFADPTFEIRTPLVSLTKLQTMELGFGLGVLEYLLETTVTCYEGKPHEGCGVCPACKLRNDGVRAFVKAQPGVEFSWKGKL